jgi:nitrogen fixation/metabolism regulation signal transduction histidine kinase
VLGAGILAVLLAVFLGYAIVRSITRPLDHAVEAANGLAAADLTTRNAIRSGGTRWRHWGGPCRR